MSLEHVRAIALVMAFILFAIGVAWLISPPPSDPFVIVKTNVVNTGDEFAKRRDAFYDARMGQ